MLATDLDPADSIKTDIYGMAQEVVDEHRPLFANSSFRARIKGKCLVIASSDVHLHAAGR